MSILDDQFLLMKDLIDTNNQYADKKWDSMIVDINTLLKHMLFQ